MLSPQRNEELGMTGETKTLQKNSEQVAAHPIESLWYTRCPVPTASSVAIDHGWLDDEFAADDITISSLLASTKREVRESHFDHMQAGSFRQGGNIPPIWTRSRDEDVALIGLTWVDEYQAILTLPETGIRSVADLRGRRLGLPSRVNDQIDFFRAMCLRGFLTALSFEGMDEKDVELVDLPVGETYIGANPATHTGTLWAGGSRARRQHAEAFALIRGEVDAIYTAGAAGAHLAAFLGAHEVVEFGFHPDRQARIGNMTPAALTVSGALSRDRPDLVARYVKRLLRAADWAAQNPRETALIVAADVAAPLEWVEAGHGSDFHTKFTPDLSDESIDALISQKDFLLKWGFIEHDFDVRGWVEPKPLEMALSAL
jgi:ABC-type nitrate/sulfonate/bicarbonate transport system substrate-binding protein